MTQKRPQQVVSQLLGAPTFLVSLLCQNARVGTAVEAMVQVREIVGLLFPGMLGGGWTCYRYGGTPKPSDGSGQGRRVELAAARPPPFWSSRW